MWTAPSQHSPLGFVLLCSGSWGADTLVPLGTEPPPHRAPLRDRPSLPCGDLPTDGVAWQMAGAG